jgi:glyoxylase-like metal-dependent hydrolase (beta-lactamase superfamily II)
MLVRQMKVGPMQNFVYILAGEPSREAMAIDSGWETGPIVAAARDEELEVKFVVATHHHPDHTATIWELARMLDAKVATHRNSPFVHDISSQTEASCR